MQCYICKKSESSSEYRRCKDCELVVGSVANPAMQKKMIDRLATLRAEAEMGKALETIISTNESVNLWKQEGRFWIEVDTGGDNWIPAKGDTLAAAIQSAKSKIEVGGGGDEQEIH